MNTKLKTFFTYYFILVFFDGVISLSLQLLHPANSASILSSTISLTGKMSFLIPVILLILSILAIILVNKTKQQKFFLFYPIYFLSYLLIMIIVVPLIIGIIYTYPEYLTVLDNVEKYYIIFYMFSIIYSAVMLYSLLKKDAKNISSK